MIGRSIDRYEILAELGRGGMGVVYKACDTLLDRVVALKLLPPDRLADAELRSRFLREAKAASALNHPGIVAVHDLLNVDGRDVLVMEWVDGETIRQKLARGPVPLAEGLRLSVDISDAIARAHEAGIVHRDVKPSNVMVTPEGAVKVLDFGLAKLVERPRLSNPEGDAETVTMEQPVAALTREGVFLGTVDYASPEQVSGAEIDSRSDVFSFGVMAYEMLTRHHPFHRDSTIDTLVAIRDAEPDPPSRFAPDLTPQVERAVLRCLHKKPARRWQSMSDLGSVLEDAREESESGRRPVAEPAASRRSSRRWWVGTVALMAIGAAIAAWVMLRPREPADSVASEFRRLTYDSGLTVQPAISADGRFVVYSSDREGDGQSDLWVHHVNRPDPARLTHHPSHDVQPHLSPDASRVVFRSEREGGGIYLIDTLGGDARRIAANGKYPRFSPDGSQIVFIEEPDWAPTNLRRMFLVSPDRGRPRPVAPRFGTRSAPGSTGPVWSPDGRRLLFKGAPLDDPTQVDWWVAPVDGGEPVSSGALENLPWIDVVQFPCAWFGSRVLFLAGTTIEGINLYSAKISPEGLITGPHERLTSSPYMTFSPTVANSGLVALSGFSWVVQFWDVALDANSGRARDEPRRITSDAASKMDFSLSRDGSTLAYSAFSGSRGQRRTELRLRNLADGRETVPISNPGALTPWRPRLSPDAALLSWVEYVEGERVYFVAPTGEPTGRELCRNCTVLDFFSDRSVLIRTGTARLARRSLADGSETTLAELDAGAILEAAISWDDRWLALKVGLPDGSVALYAVPVGEEAAPASDWIELAGRESWVGAPRWSSGGRLLYHLSQRDDFICVWAVPLDPRTKRPAGEPFAVVHAHGGSMNTGGTVRSRWSLEVAEGRLVFNAAEVRGNVYTVMLPPE